MITLGNNVHIFARPHRREELAWCFETALGCGPARTGEYPGIDRPMLVVSFPGSGHLSIEAVNRTVTVPAFTRTRIRARFGRMLRSRSEAPACGI